MTFLVRAHNRAEGDPNIFWDNLRGCWGNFAVASEFDTRHRAELAIFRHDLIAGVITMAQLEEEIVNDCRGRPADSPVSRPEGAMAPIEYDY